MTTLQHKLGTRLIDLVCKHYNVDSHWVLSPQRGPVEASFPRQMIMCLAFTVLGYVQDEAARLVCRTHHATVIYAQKHVMDLCQSDPRVRKDWEDLTAKAKELLKDN